MHIDTHLDETTASRVARWFWRIASSPAAQFGDFQNELSALQTQIGEQAAEFTRQEAAPSFPGNKARSRTIKLVPTTWEDSQWEQPITMKTKGRPKTPDTADAEHLGDMEPSASHSISAATGEALVAPAVDTIHEMPGWIGSPGGKGLSGSETVLLAGDSPILQSAQANLLRVLGYQVMQAPDELAAQTLAQACTKLDVIMLDWSTPGNWNMQLALWFRAKFPDTRVVVACDSFWGPDLELGNSQEIVFLPKPFTSLELARILRRVLS